MNNKRCSTCKETKPVSKFNKNRHRTHADGLQNQCRSCAKAHRLANLSRVREKERQYRNSNKEQRADSNRKWVAANREKVRGYQQAYKKENRETLSAKDKAYKKRNWPAVLKTLRDCHARRSKVDLLYRIKRSLRARQNKFFRGLSRSMSMVREIGCDREFFLRHIASQFTAGMTLENYGTVWHLDHIYPLSKASIVDNPVHFLAAANWRNLQPLPGPENLEKSDEVTPEAQALFDSLVQEFTRKVVAA